jgi:hypothetical protein
MCCKLGMWLEYMHVGGLLLQKQYQKEFQFLYLKNVAVEAGNTSYFVTHFLLH